MLRVAGLAIHRRFDRVAATPRVGSVATVGLGFATAAGIAPDTARGGSIAAVGLGCATAAPSARAPDFDSLKG